MKHAYSLLRLLTLMLLVAAAVPARAQQAWRPFRPGLIYSYALRNGSNVTHTLRVDSAYRVVTGDSVYAFNRLMRRNVSSSREGHVKSRNNLFGARMKWTPGQSFYVFEADAQPDVQSAANLRIYPRAAVGQTWVASTAPLLTAVLQSRSWVAVLPGVQDSVATVELRSGTATTGTPLVAFVLSRRYGLIEGSPWLGNAVAGTPATAPLMSALPAPLLQSPYSPLALFTMQPGDELGYYYEAFSYFNGACSQQRTLRRILTRQQRADSLVFTYIEQTQNKNVYAGPTCSPVPSVSVGPIVTGRLAVSLISGRSLAYPAMHLLAGEYLANQAFPVMQATFMGLGVTGNASGGCTSNGAQLLYQRVYAYPSSSTVPTYSTGLDALAWMQVFGLAPGMGDLRTGQSALVYYRRSIGTPLVCGSFFDFSTLLPTRAAQAAALATLHPNPAAEVATLTLAAPARPGYFLHLTDALGRTVWSAPVPAGQTAVAVPLAGQPAGWYLLHLSGPDAPAATWKLAHE